MRESELREWIEELAEEQAEKERQKSERIERRQDLEDRRQRRLERMKNELEEHGIDPEPFISSEDSELETLEEERDERREELMGQGESVDLPNETSTFIDGATFQSARSNAYNPYYVEVRVGRDNELEFSTYDPEPLDIVLESPTFDRPTTVNWWFSFTPDEQRYWDFHVHTPYRGFYSLEIEGHEYWLWPSIARAEIIEEVRVHQNNAGPVEKRVRLYHETRDEEVQNRFDQVFTQHYGHLLTSGDQALLHVHQKFDIYYHYAASELNFGTGTGNRVPVPYVYIT